MKEKSDKISFTVPDRGIRDPLVGFSPWLEYVLAGGVALLFFCGVLPEEYLEIVFKAQVRSILFVVVAAVFSTLFYLNDKEGKKGTITRATELILAILAFGVGVFYFAPSALWQEGAPHLLVRIVAYIALLGLGFWAWACWLWFYAHVWLRRSQPERSSGQTARELGRGWAAFIAAISRFKGVRSEKNLRFQIIYCARAVWNLAREFFAGEIGEAILDALFFFPDASAEKKLIGLLEVTGHKLVDRSQPIHSTEYDERRMSRYKSVITGIIIALLLLGLLEIKLPLRETPKGVLGGKGKRISRGKVPVQREKKQEESPEQEEQEKQEEQEEIQRDSLLELYEKEMSESKQSLEKSDASIAEDAGLPEGQGSGPSAAGSPKGTKVGGTYYMFRIKHKGSWDANREGIPALMREFTKVWNVDTNEFDQPVELEDLRRHSGKYFPVLLYITGTGKIKPSEQGVENLRWYLKNGGFVFADSSGGDFYKHFRDLMRETLPDKQMRRVSYDHTIFRGNYMPWQLRSGCPTYYQHPGPNDAQGIFIDGRLAVFYSPGDLGGAWQAVGLGKRRKNVELAFRMGLNIITYAMLYGGDKGIEEE